MDREYPWTIGWQPDYIAEARLYGLDIRKNHPNAKIAVLYQNDGYGKDYLYGFKSALGKATADKLIVGEQAYDVLGGATPASQLARLKASGADTLMIFVTPTPTIQSYAIIRALNWKPDADLRQLRLRDRHVHGRRGQDLERCHGERLDQRAYLKDPASPTWANDATMKQYKAIMAKYAPGANANNGLYFYGFAKAHTFVRAMYKAGKNPTRQGLMDALLAQRDEPVRPPGRAAEDLEDRPLHHQPPAAMRFNNGLWVLFGQLVDGRPRG